MTELPRKDPLAGYREEINQGDRDVVTWPDDGTGCPVERGEVFRLRSCWVQVTHRKRVQKGRSFLWLAHLRILKADRVQLLARGRGDGHGYVSDPRASIGSGEMVQEHDDKGDFIRLVEAPEPEAVPRHDVKNLPTSVMAGVRYERQRLEEAAAFKEQPLAVRLAKLRRMADEQHIDISAEERVIERRIAAIERKVLDRAA